MSQGFGSGLRKYEVRSKVGHKMIYKVKTRSGVGVLAIGEVIGCLGKRDQCREVKGEIGAI